MRKYIMRGMLTACLSFPLFAIAQSDIDALRYSQEMFGPTARSLSLGGAFGALGADFSSVSINPAGLGVYRKSEFSLTLGFNSRTTESEFINKTDEDNSFNVDLPNLSVVFAKTSKNNNSEWKQFSFGLGYNRFGNFHSESYFEAKNNENSILDSFVDQINLNGGTHPSNLYYDYPFTGDLAYQTFLINPISTDSTIYAPVITDGGAYQSVRTSTSGGMGEFNLAFGTSYNDKVYFGLALNFPNVRYEEDNVIEERDKDNEIIYSDTINGTFDFQRLRYHQYLLSTGNGFSAKLGVIVRPADWIRIGIAYHTPTGYYMSDSYYSNMSSAFNGGFTYDYTSPDGVFSYKIRTPYRAVASLAFIFGTYGLLSFDYEFTDYASAKVRATGYDFSDVNRILSQYYNGFAQNFRGGLEWKYEKFSFRLGGAYYSTPFETGYSEKKTDQHVISYTGGIGYREKKFYFDIGYGYYQRGEYYQPYTLSYEDVPGAVKTRTDHRVLTTIGFRF